jgi:hypothetical protein
MLITDEDHLPAYGVASEPSSCEATCWICGGAGTTGEHKTKKSDLKAVFGKRTQAKPLYFHDAEKKNRRIGSLNSKLLKSLGGICGYCNSTRTQPHDRAWEGMSEFLRINTAIAPGVMVRANRIFPHDTRRQMLNVHLYFVKLFGCHIVERGILIDIAGFSKAIMNGSAHPNVYLKFGCAPPEEKVTVGMSDIEAQIRASDQSCAFATWIYDLNGIWINVMFAADGERRLGLEGAWHPRMGGKTLLIADFS